MSEQPQFGQPPFEQTQFEQTQGRTADAQPPAGQPFHPAQGQYWPTPYGPQYARSRPLNGLAIASMVLGIIWLYWLGSILAVIFGHIALNQTRDGQQSGRGFAVAGVALGWTGIGILVFAILAATLSSL